MVQTETTETASSFGRHTTLTVVHHAAPRRVALGRPWRALALDPRSRELRIQWQGAASPECGEIDTAYVAESAQSVVVALAAEDRAHRHLPTGVAGCLAFAETLTATITLEHPVGARALEQPKQGENGADPAAVGSGVAAVTHCPSSPIALTPVGATDVRDHLVGFVPTRALLCGYSEFHPPYGVRSSRTLLAGPALTALVAAMNVRQDKNGLLGGAESCPDDHGITVNAYFANATARVEVEVAETGCSHATNGAMLGEIPPQVMPQLNAVLPPSGQEIGIPAR